MIHKSSLHTYVAFLRGINVGGNVLIKMRDLQNVFESAGYVQVRTVLASGNVLFEAPKSPLPSLTTDIEKLLHKKFGRKIFVVLSTLKDLKNLDAADPFIGIKVTPETRRYVTVLKTIPKKHIPLPYFSPDKNFRILNESDRTLISVLTLSPALKTPDVMKLLESTYGKDMTTRNWNTIQKILKA